MEDFIKAEYENSKKVFEDILKDPSFLSSVEEVAKIAIDVIKSGKKIMFCGNGGSAADSQHLAAELVSRLNYDRPGMAAIALTTDTSALTAIGNDYGYEKLFSRQIQAVGNRGDMLICFSTSGRSKNIIEAARAAKQQGIVTIGFLGQDGRDVGEITDYQINIPSSNTPNIQEGHISTGHIICGLIEEAIFGAEYNPKNKA